MRNARATNRIGLSIIVCCWLLGTAVQAQSPKPLPQAHAHNDYLHERPLLDALDQGFCSVEADIYLVDGQLLVAHDRKDVQAERTLQKLYLEPLKARVAKNGGRVYANGPPLGLLIDIKSEAEPTYAALHAVLGQYADILTSVDSGQRKQGAVDVVISGNRPQSYIAAQSLRYCGIDGRVSDLGSNKPAHLLPMISDNWNLQFAWRGDGPLSDQEHARLRDIVQRAHAKGRRVRFWATPEKRAVWQVLAEAGVDLINTDDLAGLQEFLTSQP